MITTDNVLGVTYFESQDKLVIGGDGEFYEHSRRVFDDIYKEMHTDELYEALAGVFGMDWANLQAGVTEFTQAQDALGIPKAERTSSIEVMFDQPIESSYVALIGSAVNHAKAAPQHEVTLDADQWTQAVFEDRELGPDKAATIGKLFEELYYIDNPDEQRQYLGCVATALLNTNGLSVPQLVVWRKQIVTMHVHPPAS